MIRLLFGGGLVDFIGDDVGTSTGILTLQGDSGDRDFLVRSVIHHPMCMGWCSSTALAGLLFVDRDWLVKQLVFVPNDDDEMASSRLPVRSMDQQHTFGVLLMDVLKFEDSSSIWESAMRFILNLLHCRRCRRTGPAATTVGNGESR
jgi:hypothetical protein